MSTTRRRRAQHAKSAKHPKHAKPLSASYHVTIRYARSRLTRGKTPTADRWRCAMRIARRIDVRVLHGGRSLTEFAVIEPRRGREPLRTEVVKDNKTDSHFCRACKVADSCRHVDAARRFARRRAISVVR